MRSSQSSSALTLTSTPRIFFRAALCATFLTALSLSACSTTEKKKVSKSEHARLLVEVANASLMEGDPTGALEMLMRAESEDPSLPELHHSKALCLYAKKDADGALAEARKAVELRPDYSDANNTLGKFLIDAGRYQEAVAPLTKAAKDPIYRDSYKAYTNLGILAYRQGNYAESRTHLDRAIDSSPALACVAYYYRGHIELRQSRTNDAIKDYEKATKRLCGAFSDAHLALGIAYQSSGNFEKARKKYLEIEKAYPDSQVAEQAIQRLRTLP